MAFNNQLNARIATNNFILKYTLGSAYSTPSGLRPDLP
jgi:hypothetical protein